MAGRFQPNSLAADCRATLDKYSSLTAPIELRDAMLADFPHHADKRPDVLHAACRRALAARAGGEVLGVDIEAEPAAPWQVVDGHYSWRAGNGQQFHLSVEMVDELFYNFSKHGLDLSQTQVINKFNLHTWQWNSLKARLGLYKLSDIFSPYTVEQTPPAEMQSMVAAKMDLRFANRGLIVEQQYAASNAKQMLKVIEQAAENTYLNQKAVAELADRFPTAKVRYLLRTPARPAAPAVQAFTLADTHAGAKIKGLFRTFDYDQEQLYHYADQLIAEVNAVGAGQVWLLGLGDYIETLTGLNHPNSWKGADTFGADAIAAAYALFTYFIERIHNLTGILAVGGNHDRLTSSSKEDTASGAASVVFHFLRLNYGHLLTIDYHPKLVSREIGGINYVLKHGYTGDVSNEKKANDLIADFQSRGVFTLLLTADKHTRGTFLDGARKRWVRCPSLFTGNEYSEDLGFSSLAGSLLISAVNGFPRITDIPLIPLPKNNNFNAALAA